MIALSHKAKQYLTTAVKVSILAVTFVYIYQKLAGDALLNSSGFYSVILNKGLTAFPAMASILLLGVTNWVFEILKWKTVASTVKPIGFREAAKHSLASLTVSLPTPNRVGDYGAKALFFEPFRRKKILALNFFSNSAQMLITILFGITGLFFLINRFEIAVASYKLLLIAISIVVLFVGGYIFKKKELLFKGLSVSNILRFIKKLPAGVRTKTLVFALCRYLIFSSMFLKVLLFFGADISIWDAIPLIFSMYLLVSLIPTFFIFDVVVRGGVSVWLFSLIEVPELIILSVVMFMWIINFVFPAILGSFFVVKYKPTYE
jgi:hypothetical protein